MLSVSMYKEDTIAAIATPPGEGGIAIVRVSGPDAEQIAAKVFVRSASRNGKLESHRLYHGKIRAPGSDAVLDEVLLALMRKPHSYTGEDIVEIHCHGGAVLTRHILGLILSQGARQAEAGEFTKRAFLNGKVDLAQAEAVLDVIRARTEKSAQLAVKQMSGELSDWVHELREELLDILVQVEAAIDFPEEEIELLRRAELTGKIVGLRGKISNIVATYDWGRLFREGARVCICGRPNVGKSSLMNALLGEDRVIVTPLPGTTRDVIEESINLGGLPVTLWDTAGIRDSEDQVEQIGVSLSRRHMEEADAVLVVLDGSEPLTKEDQMLLEWCSDRKSLVVLNKSDLPVAACKEKFAKRENTVSISAKTAAGLDELKMALRTLLIDTSVEPSVIVTNVRHRSALIRSIDALDKAITTMERKHAPEFLALDLNAAREALEEIVGTINSDDILERIFTSFCIGK